MQERKEVHRGSEGLRRAAVFSALVLVFSIPGRPALCETICSMRQFDWIESNVSSGRIGLLNDYETKRFAGVFSIFENPYLIEGLVSSNLLAGCGNGSYSAWLDWSHVGHRLYGENRVSGFFGFGFPIRGLRCVAIPAVERRGVRGFAVQDSRSLCLSASYEYRRAVRVAFEGSAYESDPAAPRASVLFIALRSRSFAFAVDRIVSGMFKGDTRPLVEARLNETCSLLVGYRSKTDEISSGFTVKVSRILLCFSWCESPALGSTLSVAAGRLWEW